MKMPLDWWWEIGELPPDPWKIGYSDPACRRLWSLDHMKDAPDIQPLKDLLMRMRREGVPSSASRIRASIPLFRVQEGEFRLQIQVMEDLRILCVDRLSHPAIV